MEFILYQETLMSNPIDRLLETPEYSKFVSDLRAGKVIRDYDPERREFMAELIGQRIDESPLLVDAYTALEDSAKNMKLATLLKVDRPMAVGGEPNLYFLWTTDGLCYYSLGANPSAPLTFVYLFEDIAVRSLGQVMAAKSLWRSKTETTYGVAAKVFWSYAFETYGVIVSDTKHTYDGQSFWVRRLQEAKQKGYEFGVVGAKLIPLQDQKYWREEVGDYYRDTRNPGDDHQFGLDHRLYIRR